MTRLERVSCLQGAPDNGSFCDSFRMAGKAPKTVPTTQDPKDFLASLGSERRREEGMVLLGLMEEATGTGPVMWGASIIGYGTLPSRSPSGSSEVEWPRVGFALRQAKMTLYGLQGHPRSEELLTTLGKHTLGAGCVYASRLEHLDVVVLRELVRHSYDDVGSAEVSSRPEVERH